MIKCSLCDYNNEYLLVSGNITVEELAADRGTDDMQVVFKICAAFPGWIREINNTQIDNAKGIDVVILMYD